MINFLRSLYPMEYIKISNSKIMNCEVRFLLLPGPLQEKNVVVLIGKIEMNRWKGIFNHQILICIIFLHHLYFL